MGELADSLRGVPDACALVRYETRWDRFVDQSGLRLRTLDFAREPEGPPLGTLTEQARDALAEGGWNVADAEEEHGWHVLTSGPYTLQLGPAECLLVDASCEALRIEIQDPCSGQAPFFEPGETFAELWRALALESPLDLIRETVLDVDDLASVHGLRERASFAPPDDAADRLERAGFARTGEGHWERPSDPEHHCAAASLDPRRLVIGLETSLKTA